MAEVDVRSVCLSPHATDPIKIQVEKYLSWRGLVV